MSEQQGTSSVPLYTVHMMRPGTPADSTLAVNVRCSSRGTSVACLNANDLAALEIAQPLERALVPVKPEMEEGRNKGEC
jgi:hypothetical protein